MFSLAVLAAGCGSRWSEVDRFVNGLRCGMAQSEVEKYVTDFDQSLHVIKLEAPNEADIYVEHETATRVGLWFVNDALREVNVSWVDRPLHRSVEPRRSICR